MKSAKTAFNKRIQINGRRHWIRAPSKNELDLQLQKLLLHKTEMKLGISLPKTQYHHTFGEACDYWLAHRTKNKTRTRDDESIIKNHLRPSFGCLALSEFECSRAIVDGFLNERSHLSPKTVNNQLTLLKAILNQAIELGWLRSVQNIKKLRIKNYDFRYLKTKEEIRRFLDAAKLEGPLAYALYATALLTGMRQGEIAGLKWEDVDFARRSIRVQRSFHGFTKSGKPRSIPIFDALLPILREWRLKCPGEMIFFNEAGNPLCPSARIFKDCLWRIIKRAGFKPIKQGSKIFNYVHFHGLRHTFASHWVMDGRPIAHLKEILGHTSVTTTERYAHLAPEKLNCDPHFLKDVIRNSEQTVRYIGLSNDKQNFPTKSNSFDHNKDNVSICKNT